MLVFEHESVYESGEGFHLEVAQERLLEFPRVFVANVLGLTKGAAGVHAECVQQLSRMVDGGVAKLSEGTCAARLLLEHVAVKEMVQFEADLGRVHGATTLAQVRQPIGRKRAVLAVDLVGAGVARELHVEIVGGTVKV